MLSQDSWEDILHASKSYIHRSRSIDMRKLRIFTLKSKKPKSSSPSVLNMHDAFGILSKQKYNIEICPLLVMEVKENEIMKRYLVPHRYAGDGRWLLFGQRVFVFLGHAFVEHRSLPNTAFTCFIFLNRKLRITEDYYRCRDCHIMCETIDIETVHNPCSKSTILSVAMNFPYDSVIEL